MPQKNEVNRTANSPGYGQVGMHKDTSVSLKRNEHSFVDRNCHGDNRFINTNGDGYTFAKVRVRATREPVIGDKFSSMHAQKGTVGMMFRQEDMPFTRDGLVPDIIINPHAIPSRMTIGQLMECIMGKATCCTGVYGDATPFNASQGIGVITDMLEANGLERHGNEVMYDARTGVQMDCTVFIGPTYYQRLKHMVEDKVHARAANGPVVLLTRQPAEGRARDGGLRIGEMETEAIWAHGAMQFAKERMMECSDNYRVFICRKCRMMADVNPEKGIFRCRPCDNRSNFAEIRIPYACKLMFQEMQSMSIATKFIV
jgi:DNA-directed RNA polymerase II subunit RPB2